MKKGYVDKMVARSCSLREKRKNFLKRKRIKLSQGATFFFEEKEIKLPQRATSSGEQVFKCLTRKFKKQTLSK
jgi:hypothetical protein